MNNIEMEIKIKKQLLEIKKNKKEIQHLNKTQLLGLIEAILFSYESILQNILEDMVCIR